MLADSIEAKFTFPATTEDWLGLGNSVFTTHPMLGVLILLMAIDVVIGTLAAGMHGKLSSSISQKGMAKKFITLLMIVAAKVMEMVVPQVPFMTLGCLGFIAVQLKSIVENCGRAGVPLPYYLERGFAEFREKQKLEEKPPTVVEVNMPSERETPKKANKPPSDVILNVHDSGELEIRDENTHASVVIPRKGEKGERGEKGEPGAKGDRGESYPPEK